MSQAYDPSERRAQSQSAEPASEAPEAPDSPHFERFGINAGWVEELEGQYNVDAGSVDESWTQEFGAAEAPHPQPHPHPQLEPALRQAAPSANLRFAKSGGVGVVLEQHWAAEAFAQHGCHGQAF